MAAKIEGALVKGGDSNTKFFHRVVVTNRRRNFIESFVVDGVRIEGEEEFNHIEEGDSEWLERAFEEKEVYEAVSSCAGDKALGPDGFSLAFFQLCWDTIKGELMEAIEYFHVNGVSERSINVSFITIVPKKESAFCIRDYRPISLVGSIYKIISKVLSNRLKKFLTGLFRPPRMRLWKVDRSWMLLWCLCGFYGSSTGLRQGDVLSPMLLILVMDALSKMMDHAACGGFLRGFSTPIGVLSARRVSHLLFADDTLVFCDANMDQLTYLKQVLQCKVGFLPTTYLGLPLGASHKDTTIWNSVIERVEKRLAGWQKRYLSKGGKEVLIKSTLSSMSTYYLSMLQAPVSITEKLERLQRNFLWDAVDGTRKFHLVNWQTVTSPKKWGGLGVKDLRVFNRVLWGKWRWRFRVEEHALWREVIVEKYDSMGGGWRTKAIITPFGCGMWRSITKNWEAFSGNITYRVGDGRKINFWNHRWCGEDTLRVSFTHVFRVSNQKELMVQQICKEHGGGLVWDLSFRRNMQDWETAELQDLLTLLYGQDRPQPLLEIGFAW
uniref:Reverse transcriptase domain-containing protein n=1 Tax=Nicotiana tabacum TaxID=4097 RepID=A0A1S4CCM8_TOBAC|nr:PREDICTED: uncharacterized protein LOC107817408 [Nicotiana tabacum]